MEYEGDLDEVYGERLYEPEEPAVCGSGLVISKNVTWTCGLRPHTEGKHHDIFYDRQWLPIPNLAPGVMAGSS